MLWAPVNTGAQRIMGHALAAMQVVSGVVHIWNDCSLGTIFHGTFNRSELAPSSEQQFGAQKPGIRVDPDTLAQSSHASATLISA